ncbi:MAG: TGc domain-containing protein [Oscillospiraceae bacterium]|jgi:hypothetical protein
MNEHDFDEILVNTVPELPPEEIVHEVTPWRKAMNRILIGMAMCALTLNFLALNYILPTIGMILLLLGFRTLRSENGWFKGCWILTLLRTICYFPAIIVNATIYQSAMYDSVIGKALNIVNPALQFLLVLCLWKAIEAVQKKADTRVHAGSAAALLIWYTAFTLLALVRYNGLILGIAMIVCYILIIRSLYHLSKEMEESGYAVKAASVHISDGNLAMTLVSVLAVGIACGYLFFGSYNMGWQAEKTTQSTEILEIKDKLLSLGYPEVALNDLSDEDILTCKDALRVVSQEHDEPVNEGRKVRETKGNSTFMRTVYDVKELHFTDVAVELPGETPQWKIFHHFLWTVNPGFCGTESLQLWPAYRNHEGWTAAGDLRGRVLYDKNGTVYTAPFHSLTADNYTSDSLFWGTQDVTDIFATFSMPRSGERQRGYISYGIEQTQEGWIVDAWVNYTHQKSRFQYPVLTAEQNRKTSGWNNSYSFITVQNALQFYITEEGIDLFSQNNP